MRQPRNPLSRHLARCAALVIGLGASVTASASAPERNFEELLAEADELAIDDKHAEALDAYEKTFEAMPAELRASGVGELVVLAAGKAALADYEQRGDVESLERARVLLVGFVTAVSDSPAASPPSLDAAQARLADIDAALPAPAPDEGEQAPPPLAPEPPADLPADTPAQAKNRKVALALAVSGGVATLGGVALIVAGTRQVPWFTQKMEEIGWTPDHPAYEAEAAKAERSRNLDLGLGSALTAVGVGLGITGAVLLARGRKGSTSRLGFTGFVRADGFAFSTSARF